jgi:hypothetical protein
MVNMTHGVQARTMSFVDTETGSAAIGITSSALGNFQIDFGCQNLSRTMIETIEAMGSKNID